MNRAAVSYIERGDGRILCVWNSRYGGWTLPGGKVEEGETVEAAQERDAVRRVDEDLCDPSNCTGGSKGRVTARFESGDNL